MAEELIPSFSFTEDRLNELRELFPESFQDGKINLDVLKEIIGENKLEEPASEFFGLNWMGKKQARRLTATPPTGTLKPAPGEGENEDVAKHIFIEGDNLEVLKVLRKSYSNKVKMIYIDPPYNTGSDFIYKDSFADSTEDYLRKTGEKTEEGLLVSNAKTSGKFHANWLNFMYPRIRLAKDMLTDEGLIFVSIDSNEIENLKLMMNEIFGEENSENFITWRRRHNQPNDKSKVIGKVAEYILVFAKNLPSLKRKSSFYGVPLSESRISDYTNPDDDNNGEWTSNPWKAAQGRGGSAYVITTPTGVVYDETWYGNQETFEEHLKNGRVHWTDNGNGYPRIKIYLKDALVEGQTAINWFPHEKFGSNQDASSELEDLFDGKKVFDNPKPTKLMSALQKICFGENPEIFMDFFAGSGSSLHAILRDNEELNRDVTFIGVQLPELINEKEISGKNAVEILNSVGKPNNLAELSKLRISKVIKKHGLNQGFRVYKLGQSNIYKWQDVNPEEGNGMVDYTTQIELSFKNPLTEGVTTEDFITEIILQKGFDLNSVKEEVSSGIFKITDSSVPFQIFITMLHSFNDIDFSVIKLQSTDHFVCLDKAFEGNNSLKQNLDNQCKLFTI